MYFWNVPALREDLRSKRTTSKQKMYYFLAYSVLTSALLSISGWFAEEVNSIAVTQAVLVAAITMVGILVCFRANDRGDGVEFIDRFICISWPVCIRLIVFFLTAYLALVITAGIVLGEEAISTIAEDRALEAGLALFMESIYFIWMRAEILRISAKEPQPLAPH